jgi:hypothetical protein
LKAIFELLIHNLKINFMKTSFLSMLMAFFISGLMMSCEKDPVEVVVDSALPQGNFTKAKMGSLVAQSDTGTKGMVLFGSDSKGTQFISLGSDFSTVLATGTVTVYLSTSAVFKASPGTGNPDLRLIGQITKNGEQYFKLDPAKESKFTHLILWCGTAAVPFGNASLN